MPSFFQEIQTPQGKLNFHFMRLFSAHGYIYFISVMDSNMNLVNVEMEERDGRWYIFSQNAPPWIRALEVQFCRTIRHQQAHRSS